MVNHYIIIFLVILLLHYSCKKREWNNPFDPDCPKGMFTPSDFTAIQEFNSIKLTWKTLDVNIEGFIICRNENDGTFKEVKTLTKEETIWNDLNIIGGRKYGYQLVSYAAGNKSSPQTVYITPFFKPTISTAEVLVFNPDIANSGGVVTNDGGAPVTNRGVCYGIFQNPTISSLKTSDGAGTGSFISSVMGLIPNTVYYLRAFAINSIGTSYGDVVSFKTLQPNTVKDYDGNIYPTIQIGNQVWMKENLKTTKFGNGESIPYWSGTSSRGYCWYNHDANYKNTYGAIYNYYTAADVRKICPVGWHLPSNDEWMVLINFIGGESIAGGKLKETGTNHWASPNSGATNSSGFTALPGGVRDCASKFISIGTSSGWWSSDSASGGWVKGVGMSSTSSAVNFGDGFDCNAQYIRCVKN